MEEKEKNEKFVLHDKEFIITAPDGTRVKSIDELKKILKATQKMEFQITQEQNDEEKSIKER